MIIDAVQADIITLLNNYMDIPVIKTQQTGKKPDYPYGVYTFTSSYIPEKGRPIYKETTKEGGSSNEQKRITNDSCVASFTFLDNDPIRLNNKVNTAVNYFMYFGLKELEEKGIVVVEIMDVSDRTVLLENVVYEQKAGFDVRFRFLTELVSEVPTVDKVVFNKQ